MSNRRLLLGWDTATPSSGLVLMEGEEVLAALDIHLDRFSTGKVFVALDALLKMIGKEREAIGAMGLVRGPGSFTGIRLAVSAAKGLALALNLPIYPCTTTEAIAKVVPLKGQIIAPILDARRGQGYGALFRWSEGRLERLTADMAMDVERWREAEGKVLFVGPGVRALGLKGLYPTPLAALGAALLAQERIESGDEGADPFSLSPLYIRPSDAEASTGIKVSSWD